MTSVSNSNPSGGNHVPPRNYINYLVPIAWGEMKKFLPMWIMVFFVGFNYNILKTTKDTIMVFAAGAEAIPFVKLYVMLPMAVLMTAFFTYLSQYYSFKRIFYFLITLFLLSICAFLMLVFPNRETFFFHSFADYMSSVLPSGMQGLVSIIRYWPLAMFYTLAELWGSTVLFILFWGFANQITKLEEAKRYYPLFSVASNISGLAAPQIFIWAMENPNHGFDKGLFIVGLVVAFSGVLATVMFAWINRYVLSDISLYPKGENLTFKKPKQPMSFIEGVRYLAGNKYVRNIALIVLIYNIVINLTEVVWKGQLASLYKDPRELGIYFSNVMIYTSALAIFFDLFISSNCIRRFGWTVTALLTPVVLLVTSIGVFSFMFFDTATAGTIAGMIGFSVLSISASFGSLQNIMARASKYSLFDTSKEIAFIPLDTDTRLRAKAAIDGVGSRLGKAGGSVVLQVMFLFFGNIASSTSPIALVIFALVGIWLFVTVRLGGQFKEQTAMASKRDAARAEGDDDGAPTDEPVTAREAVTEAASIRPSMPVIAAPVSASSVAVKMENIL